VTWITDKIREDSDPLYLGSAVFSQRLVRFPRRRAPAVAGARRPAQLLGANMMKSPRRAREIVVRRLREIAGFAAVLALAVSPSAAGNREEAKRMHDRLAGVPPSQGVLDTMTTMIGNADAEGAAQLAMQNPAFYNSTLKTFITPWTNTDQNVFRALNDYTATVIGIIRDDRPFTEVLTGNTIYIGRGGAVDNGQGIVPDAYSQSDNFHYEQLESQPVDLSSAVDFVPWNQDQLPGAVLDASETAGVITTRAAGEAFFSAGTNRRMWRYLAINYLCADMEQLSDNTRPIDRIRQDVSRSPGGDSQIFLNGCSGCHSGMDPLAGAFAYFEWDENAGRVVHTRGNVQQKYLINANTFAFGHVTIDDRWENYWREGQNAIYGWSDGGSSVGYGAKSLGIEVANSRGFARCQVQKVFQQVCFREPADEVERLEVEAIADDFETSGYSLKTVFAKTAAYCRDK
jgi:hypothetical protein